MSAEVENPYFVDSQFQSAGWSTWRNWVSRKSTPQVPTEPDESLGAKIQQLHRDVASRAKNLEKFKNLKKTGVLWVNNVSRATVCLYECLYVFQGILYQGHSIFHDIYRDEKRPKISAPAKVMCKMYECGFQTEGAKMWVPKSGSNVLWRSKSNY